MSQWMSQTMLNNSINMFTDIRSGSANSKWTHIYICQLLPASCKLCKSQKSLEKNNNSNTQLYFISLNNLRFYLSGPLICAILARLIGTLDASKRTLGSLNEKCLSGGQIFWSWLDSLSVVPQLFITTSFLVFKREKSWFQKKKKKSSISLSVYVFAWNSTYPRTYLGWLYCNIIFRWI